MRAALHVLGAGTVLVAGALLFVSGAAGAAGPKPTLVVAGSGANLAAARRLADAFARVRPDIRIEIPSSIGTTGAARAAADGAIAVGMVSRPLNDREQQFGLTIVPYARTPIVIGAHPAVADDQEMARALAKTAHAVGFSDTGALVSEGLPIKPLRVNGAAPTAENVRAGKYRLVKTLAFVFRNDRLAPDARAFIDFARSSEGARVLAAHGYLPGS